MVDLITIEESATMKTPYARRAVYPRAHRPTRKWVRSGRRRSRWRGGRRLLLGRQQECNGPNDEGLLDSDCHD
jgi:hypothetical protein